MPQGFFLAVVLIITFFISGILLSGIINLLIPLFRTPRKDIKRILEEIDLKDEDIFVDLGSGDARVIFEARKRNKNTELYGYEISPILLLIGDLKKTFFYPLDKKMHIEAENLFDVDYSKATKIYCYLSPEALEILREKFEKYNKKILVYSYKYKIPNMKEKKEVKMVSGEILHIYEF